MNSQELGIQARNYRKSKGWSQNTLYLKSGVSMKIISEFENGKRDIQLCTLFKIADALGLKINLE